MNYIGIDIHKKQCVLSALNDVGECLLERGRSTDYWNWLGLCIRMA